MWLRPDTVRILIKFFLLIYLGLQHQLSYSGVVIILINISIANKNSIIVTRNIVSIIIIIMYIRCKTGA